MIEDVASVDPREPALRNARVISARGASRLHRAQPRPRARPRELSSSGSGAQERVLDRAVPAVPEELAFALSDRVACAHVHERHGGRETHAHTPLLRRERGALLLAQRLPVARQRREALRAARPDAAPAAAADIVA